MPRFRSDRRRAIVGLALALGAAALPARAEPDPDAMARRLAQALRFRTLSAPLPGLDAGPEFDGLHGHLARSFPLVHAELEREVVNGRSLLYTWRGADPSLPALLLLGHQDVVPADEGERSPWSHPPFGGVVADGYVWGRGALDDKVSVMGILEACEELLRRGFRPERSVLLAFGHDEEEHGEQGAKAVAALLARRGAAVDFVLDEGGLIGEGMAPGVEAPVAVVATAEKGAANVELSVRNTGPAHSSAPARETPVGVLAHALARLEDDPAPTRLVPPVQELLAALAPRASFPVGVVLAHADLLDPLVRAALTRSPATNALVRTTAVATMLAGSPRENVIPDVARAVVNVRILPPETVASATERLRVVIDDPRVELRVLYGREPSPVASSGSRGFELVRRSVVEVFPDAVVAPYLATGGTDARHYAALTPNLLRFAPLRGGLDELRRAHGVDERIAVAGYADAVRFYERLLLNASGREPSGGDGLELPRAE